MKYLILMVVLLPSCLFAVEVNNEQVQLELTGEKNFHFEDKNSSGEINGYVPGFYRREDLNLMLGGQIYQGGRIFQAE
jgi:hypothetical protein